jgi:hypothetical protein
MSEKKDTRGGLSLQTLVIASLSSLAAALFIHEFWQGGAILGAAVTPVIVAIVSEALRKPAEVITARTGRTVVNPPPVVGEREDKFGIWEDQKPRRRLHVGLAVATGLVAFAIAAFFLTGAELVLGGASDSDRFRVVPGKQERSDRGRGGDRDEPPATTQPQEEETPAPEEQEDPAPETTPPPTATTPPPAQTTPPEELAPPQTTPPPDPDGAAPTP